MPHRELLVRAFGSIDFESEMTKNGIVAASGAVILVVLTGRLSTSSSDYSSAIFLRLTFSVLGSSTVSMPCSIRAVILAVSIEGSNS
jgi:hypothetical protein